MLVGSVEGGDGMGSVPGYNAERVHGVRPVPQTLARRLLGPHDEEGLVGERCHERGNGGFSLIHSLICSRGGYANAYPDCPSQQLLGEAGTSEIQRHAREGDKGPVLARHRG